MSCSRRNFFTSRLIPKNTVKPVQSATPQQAAKPPAPAPNDAPHRRHLRQPWRLQKSELYTIDTDLYKIVFSNHGAVVRSWELKQYRDGTGKPLELVNAAAAPKDALSVFAACSNRRRRRPM